MDDQILIVNENDEIIDLDTKENCHNGDGILHRAITIFVFNDENEILLTKRSEKKKLWPNFWDTSCSTHPRQNETYQRAGERRLKEELGFSCKLEIISKFQYQAHFINVGSENEVCTLLVGNYTGKISSDSNEVSEYKWVYIEQLKKEVNNADISPWLKIAFEKYLKFISNKTK